MFSSYPYVWVCKLFLSFYSRGRCVLEVCALSKTHRGHDPYLTAPVYNPLRFCRLHEDESYCASDAPHTSIVLSSVRHELCETDAFEFKFRKRLKENSLGVVKFSTGCVHFPQVAHYPLLPSVFGLSCSFRESLMPFWGFM